MNLDWDESYSVGVAELDKQHQMILAVVRELAGCPKAETRSEEIAEWLDRLTRYGELHFRTEEELLRDHRYPEYDSHAAGHRLYRETIARLCVATTLGVAQVPEALLTYVRGWWINHIQIEDRAYQEFLNDRGVR